MAIHELLPFLKSEAGLWLAAVAGCAGLALSWLWWFARRGLRNRALRILGYVKPTGSALASGMRYAGVITAVILTVIVLTPAVPGAGDLEQAAKAVPTASPEITPVIVIVEVHSGGATIVVHGDVVEIHVAPNQPTPVATAAGSWVGNNVAVPTVTATPPASVLPEGME